MAQYQIMNITESEDLFEKGVNAVDKGNWVAALPSRHPAKAGFIVSQER
jgi:hypothetical protein